MKHVGIVGMTRNLSGGGCNAPRVSLGMHVPSTSQANELGELEGAQPLYRRVGIFGAFVLKTPPRRSDKLGASW